MRKTYKIAVFASIVFGLSIPTGLVFAQESSNSKRMLIGFKNRTNLQTSEKRENWVRNAGGQVCRSFHLLPAVSANVPENLITELKNHPDIDYIEEDIIMQAIDQELPWGVEITGANQVWTANKGAGVNIAILDTGIDTDHPDLVGNIAGGVNYTGSFHRDGGPMQNSYNDRNGHGSHCAGIIAASDNDIGVVGVAPEARLWAVKVLGDDGSGYVSDIIKGLQWCVDNGINIVSMSFGGEESSQSLKDACDKTYAAGVLLVAAAGNGGSVYYPAAYDSVVAVSATDSDDSIADFSSTGPEIEIAAPGVNIYSTYLNGGYISESGTSMACPHVAGAAALIYASMLGLTSPDEIRARLRETARDLGDPGKDDLYGYGRVDAAAAATATPVLTTIEVSPDNITLYTGDYQQFTHYGWDQFGNAIDTGTITWTSSNETVGTIDSSGLFTAMTEGTTTISAGSSGIYGISYVTVMEPEPSDKAFEFYSTVQPKEESIHIITLKDPATLYARLTWADRYNLRLRIYDSTGTMVAQANRSTRRNRSEEILINLDAGDWSLAVKSDTRRQAVDYVLEVEILYLN